VVIGGREGKKQGLTRARGGARREYGGKDELGVRQGGGEAHLVSGREKKTTGQKNGQSWGKRGNLSGGTATPGGSKLAKSSSGIDVKRSVAQKRTNGGDLFRRGSHKGRMQEAVHTTS